jgi:hypothetical protein
MTVIGALSSFRELGEMSPHKRASSDQPIARGKPTCRILASGLLARVSSVLSRSTALQFRRAGLASEVTDENEKVWQLR